MGATVNLLNALKNEESNIFNPLTLVGPHPPLLRQNDCKA